MLLDGLSVVLVKTRFPENVGMAARACANMGCPHLHLVNPERWDVSKAAPLATPKGLPLLNAIHLHPDLESALASSSYVLGTTARTGGWRRQILNPKQAAHNIIGHLSSHKEVALVFGPEDRGLENNEIVACQDLVTIPTDAASSLNLAQAVLLMLYECAETARGQTASLPSQPKTISHQELERFLERFKSTLLALDCLHGDNVDYFFLPWKRLFGRAHLSRRDFDALMGLCRQIENNIRRPSQD